MNRSYSKIRHIQESNQKLENRLLTEQVSSPKTPTPQKGLGFNPATPLTDVMMLLMRKVYLRYKPLGRNGIDTNKKKDDEVLQIQKYLNSTGTLGKGQKYGLLKENGIFDGDTFWQVNNTLGSVDRDWWLEHKY